MAGESGEIILKTQSDSEADEVTSPTACSGGEYGRYLTGSALVRKTGQRNRKKNGARAIENRVSSTGNIVALQRIAQKYACASNSSRERAQNTGR